MIWINKETFPYKQVEVASPDITAVLLLTSSPMLAVSVYVPPEAGPSGIRTLTRQLDAIHCAH